MTAAEDAADAVTVAVGRFTSVVWITDGVAVMYGLCFSLSVLASVLSFGIIFAIARSAHCRRPYVFLVLSLCTADIMVAIATIGFHASQYLRLSSLDSGAANATAVAARQHYYCAQHVFYNIWYVATYGNLLTIMVMTMDHLVALRWPHSHSTVLSRRNVLIAMAAVWAVSFCIGMLKLFIVLRSYHPKVDVCTASGMNRFCCQVFLFDNPTTELNQEFYRNLFYLFQTVTILLVLSVMVCVYAYMIRTAWATWIARRASSATAPRPATPSDRMWRRLVMTTAMLLATFCLFWLPYMTYSCLHGLRLIPNLKTLLGEERMHLLKVGLLSLVCIGGIVDPFIYGVRVPEVRTALRRAFAIGGASSG